ncbi:hypothetical protein BKA70DRAFT_42302 [Coprinopsis sp. MPI-PUGE-AT-0042]|nr:hypothetical protein BKA70DRAFT_42302 [Coprinopsis sp. MPI-PUGE-AT-0042]
MTPTVTTKDATTQPDPPPDLKYTNLLEEDKMGSDIRKYPVLVWGKHTYWSLAHHDNRYGMAIIAYDKRGNIAGRWEKGGARYIVRVVLHRDRVEFVGQGGLSISFPLSELKIST